MKSVWYQTRICVYLEEKYPPQQRGLYTARIAVVFSQPSAFPPVRMVGREN